MIVSGVLLWAGVTGCQTAPRAGDLAPDFATRSAEGKSFTLSDVRGKSPAALYFYPDGETPGYLSEAGRVREQLRQLKQEGREIIAVAERPSHAPQVFEARDDLAMVKLADPDGRIARQYGVPLRVKMLDGKSVQLRQRTLVLIDKDGRIESRSYVRAPHESPWAYVDLPGVHY
jgi:peroxiredoxin Q/BCP